MARSEMVRAIVFCTKQVQFDWLIILWVMKAAPKARFLRLVVVSLLAQILLCKRGKGFLLFLYV